MVAKAYWRFHCAIDLILAGIIALFLNHWAVHYFVGIQISPNDIREIGRDWLGVCLSIFGLIAATIAFMFSVIDLPQFNILKVSKSRFQFWSIFVFNLQTLLFAAVWCALISFGSDRQLASIFTWDVSLFLAILVFTELLKFTWLMGKVVGVRANHDN